MIRRRIPMDALQAGVYGILTEHDLDIPVYDSLPADASPPYIVIGAFTWRRDGNKTVDKGRATSQIHIWSAYAGKTEINQIMNDVTALLTSWRLDLSDADFVVLDQDVEMAEAFETEENGQHGVVTFVADLQNVKGG